MSIEKNLKLGKALTDAVGVDTQVLARKGGDFLKKVMGGYWERMGAAPAKAAYEGLTKSMRGMAPTVGQTKVPNPIQPNWKKGVLGPRLANVPLQVPSGRYPANIADINPFFNPERVVRDTSKHAEYATRFMGNAPQDHKWAQFFYDHPVATAEAVGATTSAAPLIAAGAFLTSFADGGKPRSDYAAPVEPTRGSYDETGGVAASSNEYNPSVESARAAAQYRHDLEEQKQRHKIELMRMRGESRTPGVQGSSAPSGGGADVGSYLGSIYGNRNTNYF